MITVDTSTNLLIPRTEVWFNEGEVSYDKQREYVYIQSSVCPGAEGTAVSKFRTSIVDLAQSWECIESRVSKGFRRDVRYAVNNGVTYQLIQHPDKIERQDFFDNWEIWSRNKQRSKPNKKRINALFDAGALVLSVASLDKDILVFHSYLCDFKRVRLLTSHNNLASEDSQLLGYANKFLHLKTMQEFRDLGYFEYDLGGVDEVHTPGIAKFKLSFGGVDEYSYNFTIRPYWISKLRKIKGLFRASR